MAVNDWELYDAYDKHVGRRAIERPEGARREWREKLNVSVETQGQYNQLAPVVRDRDTPICHWDELLLPDEVKAKLEEKGFANPTTTQGVCWPYAFSGFNIVAIAQTGGGKTLAYAIPAIAHCLRSRREHQGIREKHPTALVIAPTRELVKQIHDTFLDFRDHSLKVACSYGQSALVPIGECDILCATLKRLEDLVKRGWVSLSHVTYLVLDEADRMLYDSDWVLLKDLVSKTSKKRQTQMWTATWPLEVQEIATLFMPAGCVKIGVGYIYMKAAPTIRQFLYTKLREEEKPEKLRTILEKTIMAEHKKALVFVNSKASTNVVKQQAEYGHFFVDELHSGMTQWDRESTLRTFASVPPPAVLVATDLAQRGLDIQGLNLVINYDFPRTIEDYVHRIGRTGRRDEVGDAYSFLTWRDSWHLPELVKVMKDCKQPVDEELETMAEEMNVGHRRPWGGREMAPGDFGHVGSTYYEAGKGKGKGKGKGGRGGAGGYGRDREWNGGQDQWGGTESREGGRDKWPPPTARPDRREPWSSDAARPGRDQWQTDATRNAGNDQWQTDATRNAGNDQWQTGAARGRDQWQDPVPAQAPSPYPGGKAGGKAGGKNGGKDGFKGSGLGFRGDAVQPHGGFDDWNSPPPGKGGGYSQSGPRVNKNVDNWLESQSQTWSASEARSSPPQASSGPSGETWQNPSASPGQGDPWAKAHGQSGAPGRPATSSNQAWSSRPADTGNEW